MIEETGTVISVAGGVAEVETERTTACGSCQGARSCGTSVLAGLFGGRRTRLRARNPRDARPGDRVVLGVEEAVLQRVSLVTYLLPLGGLFLGAILAAAVGERLRLADTEPASILGGLLGIAGGLLLVRRFARRREHDPRYQVSILRVLTPAVSLSRIAVDAVPRTARGEPKE